MTSPPDQDLSARLAELQASSAPIMPGMPEHPRHGRAYARELKQAHRSGQLITLAAHNDAVQAAVAKALEAREDEIHSMIDDRFSGALHLRDAARKVGEVNAACIHNEAIKTLADLRAAIRSREVAG